MSDANGSIQSVQRSFALLEHLAKRPEGSTIKELSAALGMPKSTVHRLLQNMVGLGYVLQSEDTARYRPTLKLFAVASEFVDQMGVISFARPHLEKLAHQSGETVHLVVQDGIDVVYVYKTETQAMRMSSRLGLRIPMYCTGVGKALLANMSYAEVQRIWQQSDIQPITPKTLVSFGQLEKQLAAIRHSGWAVDDEENEPGIRCVAVALAAPAGTPSSAFSVSGVATRMDEAHTRALAQMCLEARQAILQDMGLAGWKA
ncbi:MAG: IclR family transcriptional regulator [Oscillospiraceae bacterium]